MNTMFYFLLALTAVLAATTNAAGPIFDTDGDLIFGGTSYYVVPIFWGPAGGGLTLLPGRGNVCSRFIGQEGSDMNNGIPVRFSNWSLKILNVPESENLNIEMDFKPTICENSTYWWVTPAVRTIRTLFIETGPHPEARKEESSYSFFQIIKKTVGQLDAYNIAFCRDHNNCTNVGIRADQGGVRRLVLGSTTRPFDVVFKKATGTETLSKTMSII